MHRLNAVYQLTNYLDDPAFAPVRGVRLEEWSRVHVRSLMDRAWSPGQQRALDAIHEGLSCTDANMLMASQRMLFLSGEPGSGKVGGDCPRGCAGCPCWLACLDTVSYRSSGA